MGKKISVSRPGQPDSIYSADDIAYIKSHNLKGTIVHCTLFLYSDNIDVIQKWNYSDDTKLDTVLILNEIFSTPKMKLYEVFDIESSPYYFIKKTSDSLPVQMIVRYLTHGYKDPAIFRNDLIGSFMTQQRIYADQLKAIMADCPRVTDSDLAMLDYRSYSFKRIIKRYSKCK